ncbi:MAG TPA: EAL domain-containing protein [Rhodocyclaceae bacterium]|nr:EAL domain-containing protein [Rhodocyclaceae bacterium]
MSMYRQLWLAIISSTLLALFGSLLASTLSARVYLSEQLTMKNSDNASALALSLSQQKPDAVSVELAVSALFDSGHYELIRVIDPKGQIIVERKGEESDHGAPEWFVHLLPLHAEAGNAQISDGWKQFGTIELVSNSRFAYNALWKSVLEMIAALAVAGLIAGYLGNLVLRRIRRPLQAVIRQARAITDRRFTTIPEPNVPELRQLASAMNATVAQLKTMFEDEASRLEAVRQEANCDPLTGLSNRAYFMSRLRDALSREDATGGALLLIRLTQLAEINRQLGREATDTMLKQVAALITTQSNKHAAALAARLNGADFALLLPGKLSIAADAESLLQSLASIGQAYVSSGSFVCIGASLFNPQMEMGTLLSLTDGALASAEGSGENTIRETHAENSGDQPRSAEEWGQTISTALEQRWVKLISFPLANFAGQLIHHECPLRLMFDASGEWQPAGRFMPVAERLRLTPKIDLAAIALGLEDLRAQPNLVGLAINLSSNSINDAGFRKALYTLIKNNAAASPRLWLEIPESGAFDHIEAFRELCVELKQYGCRVGIEHFGRQFSQIGQLHDLGLDYLKVDSSFIRGIDSNNGNQAFLKGLSSIAHTIGLLVFAEGVTSENELLALSGLGFDGATGPAVKEK